MSVPWCTILGMYKRWNKFTHVCQNCDALIEYTSTRVVREITCECGGMCIWMSQEPATITPTNEGEQMETVPYTYNPNALITIKKIVDGEATYETFKVVDLESALYVNPTMDVIEHMPNGELITHTMKRTDVSELFRKRQYDVSKINTLQSQINQIIDNLTEDYWFNPNTDTEVILSDICEILNYEPKKEISFSATFTVSGRYDIPMTDVEDFDLEAFLADTMSIDAYNGDVVIDDWSLENAEEC